VDTLRTLYPGLLVEGWKDLAPELRLTAESTQLMMSIFLGVTLFALLFGITNTMLMSVLDRVREFGVLMAVGMHRIRLFRLIIMETTLLSVTGALTGMLLGGVTVALLGRGGIDLAWFSQGLAYFGLPVMLYPVLPAYVYPELMGMVLVTAVVAAVYPALKAVRLKPAAAIRSYG
jgi:ABC-type antimicrobial peptide transport system permease subunit